MGSRFWFAGLLLGLVLHGVLSGGISGVQAQGEPSSLQRGTTVKLVGKSYPVAWAQWQDQGQLRTGLSDTGAWQILGLELLSNQQPQRQPVQWFSAQPLPLVARFLSPYRYLDVTELLTDSQPQTQGDSLVLAPPPAEILAVREGQQAWGKRVVLELSRPVYWQSSQAKNEAVISLAATKRRDLGETGQNGPVSAPASIDEDDLGSGAMSAGTPRFYLENLAEGTKVHFHLPTAHKLQVTTLSNPPRLVIDVRPDAPAPRHIAWTQGLTWHQDFVALKSGLRFPVTWLELDPQAPNLRLQPLTATPQGQTGITPLVSLARARQASAAINAGFFNRQTQLPLGALKGDQRWFSGPILNRGALAWNDQGQVKIGRLQLRETLTTDNGQKLEITHLNSGYSQKGLARYSPEWGTVYRPLTDNETVFVVQNQRISQQQVSGKAGQSTIPIPPDGYLLALRGNAFSPNLLATGTRITLESMTIPADFNRYPHLIAGGPLLLDQGQIVLNAEAEKFNASFQQQTASRSAIAVDPRGRILLVAVHHRIGGSGPTLAEMAQLLQALGARSALNLDGGSSTSLVLGDQLIDRSAVTAARINNGLGIFVRP
ncbi:hypothetical protein OLK001_21830 [Synechocystis sp. LKSZ1]